MIEGNAKRQTCHCGGKFERERAVVAESELKGRETGRERFRYSGVEQFAERDMNERRREFAYRLRETPP